MSATRADAVRVARTYIDTPFQHMGRLPGVGLDCAGVLVCVARELSLVAPISTRWPTRNCRTATA